MKRLILILVLIVPKIAVAQNIDCPETNFEPGDCITPTDPSWSWFGKIGIIEDIVYGKVHQYSYFITIDGKAGLFDIPSVDYAAVKLLRCP